MRKLAALTTIALTLACLVPAAYPQSIGTVLDEKEGEGKKYCGKDQLGNGILCDAQQLEIILASTGSGSTGGASTSSGTGSAATTVKYYAYDKLTTGPDGQACVMTGYAQEGTTPADEFNNDMVTRNVRDIHGLPLDYPPCPLQPRAPGEPAPVESASMTARRVWEHVVLPQPGPFIQPGRAITGKMAYLETGGAIAHTHNEETPIGPLRIVANGSYFIDWGDGEESGPYPFEGMSWPHGKITHEFQHVGSYDIFVTERWTATWSLGGQSDVLRTLETSGQIDDFPVQQIHAVIGR